LLIINVKIMIIKKVGRIYKKPKNYSRKALVCSCQCPVMYNESEPAIHLDNIMVKYSVKQIKNRSNYDKGVNYRNNHHWDMTYSYWGEFNKVVELPKLFSKLNDEDFTVKISDFSRDNRQMPYICEIEVYNVEKYKQLKIVEQRSSKLKNILK